MEYNVNTDFIYVAYAPCMCILKVILWSICSVSGFGLQLITMG